MTEQPFAQILFEALNKPQSFISTVLPYVKGCEPSRLNELCLVFNDSNADSKKLAAKLFIEHLGEEGAKYLTESLNPDKPQIFAEAADILAKLGYYKAIKALKKAISPKYGSLVLASIKAIAQMPPSNEVCEVLTKFYFNFSNEISVSSSIKFLLLQKEILVPQILKIYPTLSGTQKMWALKLLAETGDERALTLFAEELKNAASERGLFCVLGLGKITSEAALEVLIKNANNPEWFLRKKIAEALGFKHSKKAAELCISYLDDNYSQVRGAALESLSKIGADFADLLINKLQTANHRVKINLIKAMGKLKNERFLEALTDALRDKSSLFFTIDALGDLACPKAERALMRLLNDDVWFNRLNALEALVKIKAPDMASIASKALNDSNDMVRSSAASILTSLRKRLQETSK